MWGLPQEGGTSKALKVMQSDRQRWRAAELLLHQRPNLFKGLRLCVFTEHVAHRPSEGSMLPPPPPISPCNAFLIRGTADFQSSDGYRCRCAWLPVGHLGPVAGLRLEPGLIRARLAADKALPEQNRYHTTAAGRGPGGFRASPSTRGTFVHAPDVASGDGDDRCALVSVLRRSL